MREMPPLRINLAIVILLILSFLINSGLICFTGIIIIAGSHGHNIPLFVPVMLCVIITHFVLVLLLSSNYLRKKVPNSRIVWKGIIIMNILGMMVVLVNNPLQYGFLKTLILYAINILFLINIHLKLK